MFSESSLENIDVFSRIDVFHIDDTVEDDSWDSDHFPVQLTLSLISPDLRPKT